MTVRALIIDAEARSAAARVVAHAAAHPYRPGPGVPPPGDDPAFVLHLGDYRAVFTITHVHGGVYRHLSISVPTRGWFPNPAAAFLIASDLFGFTGWDGDADRMPEAWIGDTDEAENCVKLAQPIGSVPGAAS